MEPSTGTGIQVKGIREGILLSLDDRDTTTDVLMETLGQELAQKRDFLEGSRIILEVGSRPLQRGELAEIQALLEENGLELWAVLAETQGTKEAARELSLATRLAGSNTDLEGNALRQAADVDAEMPESGTESAEPGRASDAILLQETVRSGQSVFHEGHVIIVGDVNPGAEVVAGGNVLVWGRLRGLVHAGALGDASAVICALHLAPTQLRIANQIAIAPEEGQKTPVPEMASIRDGQIVADPWYVRD